MTTIETVQTPAFPFTVLLAKNRGLIDQIQRTLATRAIPSTAEFVRVRGEDIPMIADDLSRAGRQVLAFTGDDLVDEWIASGNTLSERLVRERIAWNDPNALYGAPALCLIGRRDDALRPGEALRKVAVCLRYRSLAERFIHTMRQDGIALEPILVTGELETVVARGVADLAIDIVLTGRTLERAALVVKRVISTSDVAVLGAP